jgi:predicted N-acetyltransferase YhbS
VVLPAYQRKGVGRAIVEALLDSVPDQATVMIYSVPGKEGFYRKLGFEPLKTGMAIFPDADAARASGYVE